jgi:hypothetical protein
MPLDKKNSAMRDKSPSLFGFDIIAPENPSPSPVQVFI